MSRSRSTVFSRNVVVVLMILAALFASGPVRAGTISTSVNDYIQNSPTVVNSEESATHSIYSYTVAGGPGYTLRNDTDSAGFGYRIVAQASADTTFFSTRTAAVYGTGDFGFFLPTDPGSAALWDISVNVVYAGVAASGGSTATGDAGNLVLSSSGVAGGIGGTLIGPGAVTGTLLTEPEAHFYQTATFTKSNVLPGQGFLSLTLDLGALSTSSEGLASIGQTSTMGSFGFNNAVDTVNDGAFLSVTLTPHLNFTGQMLNTGLTLFSGDNLNGYGTVSGSVSGYSGSSITPTAPAGFVLGDPSSPAGFDFGGALNVGGNSVTLRDYDFADLTGAATLAGGTIYANRGLRLSSTGTVSGYGTVDGPIAGIGANCAINPSGTGLTLGNSGRADGFNFAGQLNVGGSSVTLRDADFADLTGTATLAGGIIRADNGLRLSSTGTVSGSGTVDGPIAGIGAKCAINPSGTGLTLGKSGRTDGFNFGGQLNVGNSAVTLLDGDYADISGTAQLGGGTLNAPSGLRLATGSNLYGHGTILVAGGLNNFGGTIGFAGGAATSTVSGNVTNQSAGRVTVDYTSVTINGNVTNANGGTFQLLNGNVTINGTLTNEGAFRSANVSGPANTTRVDDLVVGQSGYLFGGAGTEWILSGDFTNQSTQTTWWNTSAATLDFDSTAGASHALSLAGADLGANLTGYANNFAWGTLDLTGESLTLSDGNTGNAGTALYVGEILGVIRVDHGDGSWGAGNITGNGLNIYYDPSLAGNEYLSGLRYAMGAGGSLIPSPVPIPSTLLLFGSGLLGLVGLGRRRLKA